jgi:two-component system chemotaxis sensor kinase CheA
MAKYRVIFIEESVEHLAEMSSAMLGLEKSFADAEAIDVIFRMAHSIKGMAASLQYDSIAEVAHRLEDRMQEIRSVGRIASSDDLALLFRGLERLEAMVASVRETGAPPPPDPELVAVLTPGEQAPLDPTLSAPGAAGPLSADALKKKAQSPTL